ncbi:MAG: hypothetical protein NWQ54_10225 [Paraglaciecola sp.]|uniref:hypothetical protein n=1 Tax=Pseudomonadati TaxID=3379134 RepID=UPI00273F6A2C|nr:hypothetical protein [Paraglaciecola sp.]MDP5030203.1 hypothetical protein [Paraglaciecola sp.]MDP5131252.1 hypothetical protein [Paraglaciecola sp.]
MFTKSKIAIAALTTSLIFTSSVSAKEVSVEQILTSLVSQAMTVAQQEVHYSVQEAVLNATHSVSLNEEKTYATKVTITDVKAFEADKNSAE